LFKVVPDQLRISEGWVRCGQCDEIFDASLHLLSASLQAARPEPLDVDTVEDCLDEELSANVVAGPESASTPALSDLQTEPVVQLSDVSFLRDSTQQSVWRRPLMRATLTLLNLALLLGLSGQIVFHERDRIAAAQPGLKPWLLTFCGALNCAVSPLRNIESIAIDSSSFIRLQDDLYRLNFTLKNTSTSALALPAIELTLTDSLDLPVVRRVFHGTEMAAKSATLAAGAEWPTSLAVAVTSVGLPRPVAGYRLLAFYP
jgi:predicted Zn finger-like uncharacterized protein